MNRFTHNQQIAQVIFITFSILASLADAADLSTEKLRVNSSASSAAGAAQPKAAIQNSTASPVATEAQTKKAVTQPAITPGAAQSLNPQPLPPGGGLIKPMPGSSVDMAKPHIDSGIKALPVATVESSICDQWKVPPTFIAKQWNGYEVMFHLQQDGSRLYGYAEYQTTNGTMTHTVRGNVSGSIKNNLFSVRVLWTYSGVSSIGRYTGVITLREGGAIGNRRYGFIFEGTTYDEYVGPQKVDFWNANHFTCDINMSPLAPAPPASKTTVTSIGKVNVPGVTPAAPMLICDRARDARARNSPATLNLEAQCRATSLNGSVMRRGVPGDSTSVETKPIP